MSQTLEQMLTALGIAPDSIEQARQRQSTEGGSLRENLIALELLTEDVFSQSVSDRLRMPYISPKDTSITGEALNLLPREKAEKYLALPLVLDSRHRRLSIALADPTDMLALDELKFIIGHTLIPHYTPEDELTDAIRREYSRFEESQAVAAAWSTQAQTAGSPEFRLPVIDVAALNSGEPLMRLLAAIFTEAHAKRASEIHLASSTDGLHLTFRTYRQLTHIATFPQQLATPLFIRLRRILLGDIGDRSGLLHQGTALLKLQNKKELDLSYHIHPTTQRDHVLIKLKDRYHVPVLDDLDLSPDSRQVLQEVLADLQGLVLVTGTAKNGVTTTLYSLLNTLYKPHLHMLSIESPVEMLIDGIIQGGVREDTGYAENSTHTYEEYIHYAFHQRPDVLMIDRIASPDLFHKLAVFSSGSLVLSSLPALDTASAAVKLRLLTSPGFLGTYVTCITAQRLVRTICESCKEEVTLPVQHRKKLGFGPDDRCYAGKGCNRCDQTGYIGLTPIFEVMRLTEPLKQALMRSDSAADLRTLQADQHVASLRDDGMRKVKEGITTIQEVVKATML